MDVCVGESRRGRVFAWIDECGDEDEDEEVLKAWRWWPERDDGINGGHGDEGKKKKMKDEKIIGRLVEGFVVAWEEC